MMDPYIPWLYVSDYMGCNNKFAKLFGNLIYSRKPKIEFKYNKLWGVSQRIN